MYKSIKSLAVLILFSTLFVSCASTQGDVVNSEISEIEKSNNTMKRPVDILRDQMNQFERYDR